MPLYVHPCALLGLNDVMILDFVSEDFVDDTPVLPQVMDWLH